MTINSCGGVPDPQEYVKGRGHGRAEAPRPDVALAHLGDFAQIKRPPEMKVLRIGSEGVCFTQGLLRTSPTKIQVPVTNGLDFEKL